MKNDNDLKLLDCTLRDGGYVNDWNWGFHCAQNIIKNLSSANIDIVEVGFLRNVENYNADVTVCNDIDELNRLLPQDSSRYATMYSAMAMRSNYDIRKLKPYSGSGIQMIRITAHDYDIKEGMDFARMVKERGYLLSVNPINIMGYSDRDILWLMDQINDIQPYQFSIVDTFGSMKRRDLERIVSMVDHNLSRNIRVALHLHENMSLSCCLAQNFIDFHLNRPVAVDGSLLGMGRIPGNLPIELIADYVNEYASGKYHLDYLLDAIQDYIIPLKGENNWGYTLAYFLSARFNLHRNYAEYYLGKGDLTNKDINAIFASFDSRKKSCFDSSYADQCYFEFKQANKNKPKNVEQLKAEVQDKEILLIAPGSSIRKYSDKIKAFIEKNNPIVISLNFATDLFRTDYVFISNNKRSQQLKKVNCKVIVTTDVDIVFADYSLDVSALREKLGENGNSLVLVLHLLQEFNVKRCVLAGADGYDPTECNYYSSYIRNYKEHDNMYNQVISSELEKIEVPLSSLTPSRYGFLEGKQDV